jgi:multiple sugar transport system permease protein
MTHSDRRLIWAFLAPTLLIMAVFLYWPMVGTVIESFHDTALLSPDPRFVGWAVYERVLGSGDLWQVVRNSVAWTVGVVISRTSSVLARRCF